jgi:hypothetical protein
MAGRNKAPNLVIQMHHNRRQRHCEEFQSPEAIYEPSGSPSAMGDGIWVGKVDLPDPIEWLNPGQVRLAWATALWKIEAEGFLFLRIEAANNFRRIFSTIVFSGHSRDVVTTSFRRSTEARPVHHSFHSCLSIFLNHSEALETSISV